MSAGTFITRDELDATRGLSDLAVRLYWRLRSLMDFSTCTVGQHRRISYQSLSKRPANAVLNEGLGSASLN